MDSPLVDKTKKLSRTRVNGNSFPPLKYNFVRQSLFSPICNWLSRTSRNAIISIAKQLTSWNEKLASILTMPTFYKAS